MLCESLFVVTFEGVRRLSLQKTNLFNLKFQVHAHIPFIFHSPLFCVGVWVSVIKGVYVYDYDGVCYFVHFFSHFLCQSKNSGKFTAYLIYMATYVKYIFDCCLFSGVHQWPAISFVYQIFKWWHPSGEYFEMFRVQQGNTFLSL